jgi:hypothetical protein
MTKILTILLPLSISILSPVLLFGQITEFRIDSIGTMGGHIGYYQSMRSNDTLHETDFIFEENGYVRFYAYEMSGQSNFTVLPDSTYIVKSNSMSRGDSWTSWTGQPTTAIDVSDEDTNFTPAGTFYTHAINYYLKSFPDSCIATLFFANNVGCVMWLLRGGVLILTSYSISGGSGYYPLAVGNWWDCQSPATGVNDQIDPLRPFIFDLYQNYPNPFNPSTSISFALPRSSYVSLKIFNLLGQEVAELVNGELPAGYKSVTWNAANAPSGIYFCRLVTEAVPSGHGGSFVETKKLVLMR